METVTVTRQAIIEHQNRWARNLDGVRDGYFIDPRANMPWLNEEIEREIREGDGAEFGKEGERAKIAALHSSSALAVNVFGYWRGKDWSDLAGALNIRAGLGGPQFERKFKTGVPPRSPNLDVVLPTFDGIVAIESKFTEWLDSSGTKPLRDAYLPENLKRWTEAGLPGAQGVADRFLEAPGFKRLDVPQLLKHMLGLARQGRPWSLKLVWYRQPSRPAEEMDGEITRFRQMLGADAVRFDAISYQELWAVLKPRLANRHRDYCNYLDARYFPARR